MVEADDGELQAVLLAGGSQSLRLPTWATFKPLELTDGHAAEVANRSMFCAHDTFDLPCDHGCPQMRGTGRSKQGLCDTIHRLTIARDLALPLNERLQATCLRKEAAAAAAVVHAASPGSLQPPDDGDAAKETDAFGESVLRSNWGGYQSTETIFSGRDDPIEHESLRSCRDLHLLLSAALDELESHLGAAGPQHPPPEAPERPAAGELHPAYGWINVNRSTDLNFMHVHDPLRWSAVFFVRGGERCADSNGGHLIFRGGKPVDGTTSHSYLAVPPTPSTLWLFPGSVPHAVLGQIGGQDPPRDVRSGRSDHTTAAAAALAEGRQPEAPRISIAVNFDATSPSSHRRPRRRF